MSTSILFHDSRTWRFHLHVNWKASQAQIFIRVAVFVPKRLFSGWKIKELFPISPRDYVSLKKRACPMSRTKELLHLFPAPTTGDRPVQQFDPCFWSHHPVQSVARDLHVSSGPIAWIDAWMHRKAGPQFSAFFKSRQDGSRALKIDVFRQLTTMTIVFRSHGGKGPFSTFNDQMMTSKIHVHVRCIVSFAGNIEALGLHLPQYFDGIIESILHTLPRYSSSGLDRQLKIQAHDMRYRRSSRRVAVYLQRNTRHSLTLLPNQDYKG